MAAAKAQHPAAAGNGNGNGKAPAKKAPARKAAPKRAPAKKAPAKAAAKPAKPAATELSLAGKRALRAMMADHLRAMPLTGLARELDVPVAFLHDALQQQLKYIDPELDKARLAAWRAGRAAAK
jgi:hypothetical protein